MTLKSTTRPLDNSMGPERTGALPWPDTMNSTGPLALTALGTGNSRTVAGITVPSLQVVPEPIAWTVTGNPNSFFTLSSAFWSDWNPLCPVILLEQAATTVTHPAINARTRRRL